MQRTKRFFTLCTALLLAVLSSKGQWSVVGSTGFSTGATHINSLAFDSNDTAYIAYRDDANSSKATVMKYNGSSWAAVGSAGFTLGSANYTSLAFDSNDTAYLAFSDGSNSSKASVMKYNGSSWVTVGGAGFSANVAHYVRLAFDSNDTPYVAYHDDGNASKATVKKYDGSGWVTVGSVGFSAGGARFIDFAIDGNDVPHITYHDDGNSSKCTVMKFNGSSWVNVGSAGFSASTADFTEIAFDSNDTAYVAYRDAGNSSGATVMKYNGSSWVTVGSAGFSSGAINRVDIAFDNNDTAYVVYRDDANSQKATVKKFDGSSWVTVGTTGFSAGTANFPTVVFNSKNSPYVSYRDDANSNKATVQAYPAATNTWNGSTWSGGTPTSSSDVAIGSNTAPTTFTCNNLTINSGFALNTGTSNTVTIHGDLTNNGNGVTGQGTITFTASGAAEISGDTVEHEGTVIVESGCTLTTNSLLRLTSDVSNTGRIGESDGTISGNVYVQRYMPGKRCFRFYGHPFSSSIPLSQLTDEIDITGSGGATNGFTSTGSNNSSAYYWDVSTADNTTGGNNPGWRPFTSATTNIWDQYELLRLLVRGAKGEGLTGGSYSPSAATFEGVGAVNQGTQVITLTKGSSSTFVSCGNPFPSPVQMNTVTKGSNIGANYYVWDATSGSKGAYVTNAFTLDYKLPAYAALFTTASANSNNTLTFEEQDKNSASANVFKTTGPNDWVELYIYDSTIKWDRLLINLNSNGMEVEDKLDGVKLYNPGLDFFTLSDDKIRLAVDVRPYNDKKSIPLGLTAYSSYNKYVIRTGMFNIPVGTKLLLHDKYLNKKEELKVGFEYWFDVTADSNSQGNNRFEINMVGKPTTVIEAASNNPQIQLIPNPAKDEVKVSFKGLEGVVTTELLSMTGQVLYSQTVNANTGSVMVPLVNIPSGIYIVHVAGNNVSYTEKLIKE